MTEREKQTRFLKELIRSEDRAELQELQARITKAERDERSIRSAVWLMFVSLAAPRISSLVSGRPRSRLSRPAFIEAISAATVVLPYG